MSVSGSIDVSYTQMAFGLAPVAVAMILSLYYKLNMTKALLYGVIRGTVQLGIMGYVLVWVFAQDDPWIIAALLIFMIGAAAQAGGKRIKGVDSPRIRRFLIWVLFCSILLGSMTALAYLQFVVVRPEPLWDGKYIIPLGGMMIAQGMNAGALAVERYRSELELRADEIQTLLALGATSFEASRTSVQTAIGAAMTPSINGLVVLGIVALPGMMSGQILAGVDPLLAVRYQLLVCFGISSVAALVSWISIHMTRRLYFTKDDQFIRPDSYES